MTEQWKPKVDEHYFSILNDSRKNENYVAEFNWVKAEWQIMEYKHDNCFKTRKLAQQALNQIKQVLKRSKKI